MSLISCLTPSFLASSHLSLASLASCLATSLLASSVFAAENLIPEGSFTDLDAKAFSRFCRTEDGPVSLFTEDATWNKCCKCAVGAPQKGAKHTTRSAIVSFGRDGEKWGFAVKPETTYEYSVDVRKGQGIGGVAVRATGLADGDFWRGREKLKVTNGRTDLQDVWSNVRGTFRTGPKTRHVILSVSAWSSTELASGLFADGSYFLVDNLKVEESSKNLGGAPAKAEVPPKKAALSGAAFDDFVYYATGRATPPELATKVTVLPGETAFAVAVECREPQKVEAGDAKGLWDHDNIEVWFGATAADRVSTQVAVGAGGGLHVAKDAAPCADHGVTFKVVPFAGGWRAAVKIPYALLSLKGRPAEGTVLPFNVGRYRRAARAWYTWNALKSGFNDTANFGSLVVGSYSAALAAQYGAGKMAADRADYEAQVAAAETAKLQAKFDRFAKQKLSVAPVSPIGDFAIPYLPDEIFDPPAEIRLTAAVNERKALPVAVANLSARTEDYIVLLESFDEPKKGELPIVRMRGVRGLKGFPADQIVCRKAIRMKDAATADPTLRFDPLPVADGCSSLTVAPKEAGLVWFDFDTTGVKPGTYAGRLRVIPTCEAGAFRSAGAGWDNVAYSGEMRDLPVTLEVVAVTLPQAPRRPGGFYQEMYNESCYRIAKDLGADQYLVSPWTFSFPKRADGTLDLDDPAVVARASRRIRYQFEIAKKCGRRVNFFVSYSLVYVFHSLYGSKFPDAETEGRLFQQYVKGIARVFEKNGIPLSGYSIETYDEPLADKAKEIERFHRLAKEAVPGIRLELTLGCAYMTPAELERLGGVTDEWCVWDNYFSLPEYRELFARLQKRGAWVSHYQCDTSPRTPLYEYYRKKPWFGEYHGLDGDGMYQLYDRRGGIGVPDFKSCSAGGFIYFLHDEAVPSIRSMAYREGVTDMLYLSALEAATGNSAETKACVAEAAKRVMKTKRFDPAEPDRIRAEIIRRLTRR